MHTKNRLPSSGHNTPSPPPSPLRSPHLRRRAGKSSGRFNFTVSNRSLAQRIAWIVLSVLLRRQGAFLFAPLLYISGMLFYVGTVSFDVVPEVIKVRRIAGSVYRSPAVYVKLRHEMDADNSTADAISSVWKHAKGGDWRPCVNKFSGGLPESNGYIYVEANGGLNQQRTSICNAVAVAGYLNATLVIPNFRFHSIWRDPSKFSDIYDEEFFVKTLENDVRVVDSVPGYLMERFDHNLTNVYNFKIKAYSPIQYYKDTVLPRLLEEKLIRISPFANRLSYDAPPDVQRLRCLANYEALRFSKPLLTMGETLVSRMKEHSANNGGKYISVHLRFEEDMVAFSCCVYDGGAKEQDDMIAAREKGWKGKFTKPGRVLNPGANRVNGKCPLTPLELRGEYTIPRDTWPHFSKCFLFCKQKRCLHLQRNLLHLRTILPGWLLLITRFVCIVKYLLQLKVETFLNFCWVIEDICLMGILRQSSPINASWQSISITQKSAGKHSKGTC